MTSAARHARDRALHRARQARQWRQAALIALPIVAVVGLTGVAALATLAPVRPVLILPIPARTTAATAADLSSPAAGTTGTIALPPEPRNLPAGRIMSGAALPFRTAGIAALDRGRALDCLTAAIYYEAASESDDGQRAVAQVVLNRVRHPAFPATVCGVVYQGSEHARCQFSFACDGALEKLPSRTGWARALHIAAAALAGQVYAPVGLATHYHTYAVTPAWNRTLVMTDAVGAHFFHRWKGYWGTAAAFTRRYRGGEPVPGPHARDISPLPTIVLAPLPPAGAPALPPVALAAVAKPQPTPTSEAQPSFATSGTLRDDATPASQVLDRWKESGKPRD